jgi:hypothetical protein
MVLAITANVVTGNGFRHKFGGGGTAGGQAKQRQGFIGKNGG